MVEQSDSINVNTSRIKIYCHKKKKVIAIVLISESTYYYKNGYKFH